MLVVWVLLEIGMQWCVVAVEIGVRQHLGFSV